MTIWVWAITFGLLCLLWLLVAWRGGPQLAIGCQVLVACLVPTWAKLEVTDELWLDCRTAAAIFGLMAYCLHPRRTFPLRLGWLDAAMLCLLGVHIATDIDHGMYFPWILLRVYGEWCVPYFAGRLALQNNHDFRRLAPWGATVGVLLALGSIFEGVTAEHPWELLYGQREFDGIVRDQPRWLITRAWGCCAHPIYFGFLQLMFLPWLLRVWHRSRVESSSDTGSNQNKSSSTRDGRPLVYRKEPRHVSKRRSSGWHWSWLLPLLGLAGVYCTGSRTPFLAYLLVPLLGLFGFVPRLRLPLTLAALVSIGLCIWQRDKVIELVTQWGETVNTASKVEIDGKLQQASGTATRWQLLVVYQEALTNAGLFGYGTERVTGFPVRVPIGAEHADAVRKVPFIDNQFVLMTLRFGWLGLTAFTVALMMSGTGWIFRSQWSNSSVAAISFYVGGTILAVGVGLLTVWMPQDIGFPLLWWMGAGSSTPPKRELGEL